MRIGPTAMDLSIPTLQFTGFVVFATCGSVFAACWLLHREKIHHLLFGASFFTCAVMSVWFVDFGYYGSVWSPLGWSLGGSLFWSGFRLFDNQRAVTRPMVALFVLPTVVHIVCAASGFTPSTINAASTLAYALHEGAAAHYVLARNPSRSPIRLLAGLALGAISVAICLPLLPLQPSHVALSIVAIFVVDHVVSVLLTTSILALEAEKAYSAVARQARTDPLTQLLNREGLAEAVSRHSGPACVIFADLDHFKSVNDRFGHAAGDEVLREFARRAKAILPENGHLARFGGEEFVLVHATKDRNAALILAERLRFAIGSRPISWNGQSIPVTASVGVALSDTRTSLARALEQADAALYEAKLAGRDRVQAA